MRRPSTGTYRVRDQGKDLVVEVSTTGDRNSARLRVDGTEVAHRDTDAIGSVDLVHGPHHARVVWWWRGRVARCELREKAGSGHQRALVTPFEPPPGSRARRSYELRRRHPRAYAARHVVWQALVLVGTVLGVGALLRSLLPRVDWSFLPDLALPDIDPPDWLRYLDPAYWLGWLFDWLPDWDLPSAGWLKYVLPLVFAVFVAVEELKRRRSRDQREARLAEPDASDESGDAPPKTDAS